MKTKPVVIIDSSVLIKNHKLSKGMGLWLKKLSSKNKIELHLPHIVKDEVLSSFELSYSKNTTQAFDTFYKLFKKNDISSDLENKLDEMNKQVEKVYTSKVQELKDFYMSDIFKIDDLHEKDAAKVLANYFKGGSCFSKLKNREDIPDAFIYETLSRFSKVKNVIFLCDDGKLGEVAKNDFNIEVYRSIEDFFESNELVKKIKIKIENEEVYEKESSTVTLLMTLDFYTSATEFGHISEMLTDKLFDESIGDDDSDEMTIVDVIEVPAEIKKWSVEYLGDGEGVVNFEVDVDVLVEHYVGIHELPSFKSKNDTSVESWNDHVFKIVEPATVKAFVESEFSIEYSELKKAANEDWRGIKLNRDLGSRLSHDYKIVEIEFVSFTARSDDNEDDELENDYSALCQACGKIVGSCNC